jgi:TRAP-type C4-dicarboxylate transport system substrate-binding protein
MKTRSKRSLISLAMLGVFLVVTILCSAPSSAAPAKVFKWRFQSTETNAISMYRERNEFLNKLKEMTDGGLVITQYPGSAIVSDMNIPGAVRERTIEMGNTYLNPLYANCPVTKMIGITPGFFYSVADSILFLRGYGVQDILQQETLRVFKSYAWPELTGAVLVCSNKPIKELEDFKGLKIRSYGPLGTVYQKLGASVVNVAGGEVYTALQTGVLDAANWGAYQGGSGMKIFEVTKYFLEPCMGIGCGTVNMINKAAFDELPLDYQKMLENYFSNRQMTCVYTSNKAEAEAKKIFLDKGMKATQLSDKAMAKIRELAWDAMKAEISDAPSQKVYDMLKEFSYHQDYLRWNH